MFIVLSGNFADFVTIKFGCQKKKKKDISFAVQNNITDSELHNELSPLNFSLLLLFFFPIPCATLPV